MHQLVPAYDSSVLPTTLASRSIYHLQLEQVVAQCSALAGWIVRREGPDSLKLLACYQRSPEVVDQLIPPDPEIFLQEAVYQASGIGLNQLRFWNHEVYIYRLARPSSQSKGEFIIIWLQSLLSAVQEQQFVQQAEILKRYLDLDEQYCRQQEKVELLEHIFQRVEHQLRHPLALIHLYAQNLYFGLPKGTAQEQAAFIQETVQGLSQNLSHLLHCGQRDKLRFVPYDLRMVLAESLQGLQPLIQEKELQVQYSIDPAILMIDPWQMRQVFDNLLHNAVSFSPPGGQITCTWQIFQQEVLITIADEGSGLDSTDLQQMFTPFYSNRPGGTGLGLSIAQKIVLDHAGSLWAENLPQGGAQLSIALPYEQLG